VTGAPRAAAAGRARLAGGLGPRARPPRRRGHQGGPRARGYATRAQTEAPRHRWRAEGARRCGTEGPARPSGAVGRRAPCNGGGNFERRQAERADATARRACLAAGQSRAASAGRARQARGREPGRAPEAPRPPGFGRRREVRRAGADRGAEAAVEGRGRTAVRFGGRPRSAAAWHGRGKRQAFSQAARGTGPLPSGTPASPRGGMAAGILRAATGGKSGRYGAAGLLTGTSRAASAVRARQARGMPRARPPRRRGHQDFGRGRWCAARAQT
jgi:hypothetical protein